MEEQTGIDIKRVLELEVVEEFLHQAEYCIARYSDSIRADLLVIANDQYLLSEIE